MKKILVAYDAMMLGGTTTSLLSLLNEIDESKYEIDLILYSKKNLDLARIPSYVNILPDAKRVSNLSGKIQRFIISLFNGQLIKALYYKTKPQHKTKKTEMVLWQSTEKAHAQISRKLDREYDAAIGFIESWGAHYVVSDKVNAKKRIIWIHLDAKNSYLVPEIDKAMYKKANHIVTVSSNCRDNLKEAIPEFADKICDIENILSKDDVLKRSHETVEKIADPKKINLVSVCRIAFFHKGLDRGLEAMKRLKEENILTDNIVWYWIGDGENLADAKEFIEKNELAKNVVLLGSKQNPLPYEKQMTLFFLPSRYEGKPMAVTEAQMLSLPCVVTEYASAREQIADGIDGLVLENSDEAIYAFLKDLINGKIDITSLRENISKKTFSNTETLKQIYELLD